MAPQRAALSATLLLLALLCSTYGYVDFVVNPGCSNMPNSSYPASDCPASRGFIAVGQAEASTLIILSTIGDVFVHVAHFSQPVNVSDVHINFTAVRHAPLDGASLFSLPVSNRDTHHRREAIDSDIEAPVIEPSQPLDGLSAPANSTTTSGVMPSASTSILPPASSSTAAPSSSLPSTSTTSVAPSSSSSAAPGPKPTPSPTPGPTPPRPSPLQSHKYIAFSKKPDAQAAFLLASIVSYNDSDGHARVTAGNIIKSFPVRAFNWSAPVLVGQTITVTNHNASVNATFQLQDKLGRADVKPFLSFDKSSLWIGLDMFGMNVKGDTKATCGKLAMLWLALAEPGAETELKRSRSLDDEYSPTVFGRTDVLTTEDDKHPGFMSWKPIAFAPLETAQNNTMQTNPGDIMPASMQNVTSPFAQDLFSAKGSIVSSFNISFGAKGDKMCGYNLVNWSAVSGPGKPVVDVMSTELIVTITVTLGIPVLSILYGCIRLFSRKCCRHTRSGYQPI